MKLTPLDIRKQEFRKVIRGLDPEEVGAFLEMLAREFEDVLRQHKEAREKLIEVETQLKDYKQIERILQQTLLQAQETTGRTLESARKEAELIIREAEVRAAQLTDVARREVAGAHAELAQLRAKKDSLLGRLRVLLSSELDLIKTLELGGDAIGEEGGSNTKVGTQLPIDEILKKINNDRTPETH